METWMIERIRRQREEREHGVPLHITPPEPPRWEPPRSRDEERSERGYSIVEF